MRSHSYIWSSLNSSWYIKSLYVYLDYILFVLKTKLLFPNILVFGELKIIKYNTIEKNHYVIKILRCQLNVVTEMLLESLDIDCVLAPVTQWT